MSDSDDSCDSIYYNTKSEKFAIKIVQAYFALERALDDGYPHDEAVALDKAEKAAQRYFEKIEDTEISKKLLLDQYKLARTKILNLVELKEEVRKHKEEIGHMAYMVQYETRTIQRLELRLAELPCLDAMTLEDVVAKAELTRKLELDILRHKNYLQTMKDDLAHEHILKDECCGYISETVTDGTVFAFFKVDCCNDGGVPSNPPKRYWEFLEN